MILEKSKKILSMGASNQMTFFGQDKEGMWYFI